MAGAHAGGPGGYIDGGSLQAPGGPAGARGGSLATPRHSGAGTGSGDSMGPLLPSFARPDKPLRKGSVSGGGRRAPAPQLPLDADDIAAAAAADPSVAACVSPQRRQHDAGGGVFAAALARERERFILPAGAVAPGTGGRTSPPPAMQHSPQDLAPYSHDMSSYPSAGSAPASGAAPPRPLDNTLRALAAAQQRKDDRARARDAAADERLVREALMRHMPAGEGKQRLASLLAGDPLAGLRSPLVEQVATPPAVGGAYPSRTTPRAASGPPAGGGAAHPVLREDDIRGMDPTLLRALVDAAATRAASTSPPPPSDVAGFIPERIDLSPPRTPPRGTASAAHRARAADDAVRAIEDQAVADAIRDMTLDDIQGAAMTQQALKEYYKRDRPELAMPSRVASFDDTPPRQPASTNRAHVPPSTPPPISSYGGALMRAESPHGTHTVYVLPPDAASDGNLSVMSASSPPRGPVKRMGVPLPVTGARKSLVVGVTYTGTPYAVPDSATNVHRIKACLAENGFYGEQIVLCDDGEGTAATQPTYANILAGLKWLAQTAAPGESFFLYYCGRAQQRNPSADATDILPCDFDTAGAMPDDAISDMLLSALPAGSRLTIVTDCYPGGQLLDLPFKIIGDRDGSVRVLQSREAHNIADVVQISGQRVHAAPAGPEGETLQDLTTIFCDALTKSPRPRYRSLLDALRRGLLLSSDHNVPVISSTRTLDLKNDIFVLGSPELTIDQRLIDAKQRTRDIAAQLSQAERARVAAVDDQQRQRMQRVDDRAARMDEAVRRQRLQRAARGLAALQEEEPIRRLKLADMEAAERHRIMRMRVESEEFLIQQAINGAGWSRTAAPDNPNMPVVVGVRWQRTSERPSFMQSQGERLDQQFQPGQQVRTFSVLPKKRLGDELLVGVGSKSQRPLGLPAPPGRYDSDGSRTLPVAGLPPPPSQAPAGVSGYSHSPAAPLGVGAGGAHPGAGPFDTTRDPLHLPNDPSSVRRHLPYEDGASLLSQHPSGGSSALLPHHSYHHHHHHPPAPALPSPIDPWRRGAGKDASPARPLSMRSVNVPM